ncbi:MAG: EscU/YscU/HrcU family type III secretion system export apparatus switch protein [Pseudomonadota bacterium]
MTQENNSDNKVSKQAIALKYDGTSSPQITATGQNELAEEIIRIAKENNIPIQEDPDLAVLLAQLDLYEHIPESLYFVVAEVLAFTYLAAGKTPNDFKK